MKAGSEYEVIRKRFLEGIFSLPEENKKNLLSNEKLKNNWIKTLRDTCKIEDILGATLHFLLVGRKK